MTRFTAELKLIERLSMGGGFSPAMQTILVSAGVIGGLMLLSHFVFPRDDESNLEKLSGPLAPYVAGIAPEDQLACRAAKCTFATSSATLANLNLERAARYIAPPAQTVTAPPGQVFRNTRSFSFDWITSWVSEPTGHTLVHLSGEQDGVNDQAIESGDAVKVTMPGYVRSAKLAKSGQQLSLSGSLTEDGVSTPLYAGQNGRARLRTDNPPFKSLEFQPFDKTMTFEIGDVPDVRLAVGDDAVIHFDRNRAPSSDEPGTDSGTPARVTKVSSSRTPPALTLQLTLNDDHAMRVLRERVLREQGTGQSAFPEKIWITLSPLSGPTAHQSLRIPASAIVRNGSNAMVWLVIEEFAIPVAVDEIHRDATSSMVVEKSGAHGLPIQGDHWRLLSAYCRSRVYLAAGNLQDAKVNKLLNPDSRVINQPTDALRPGIKVRNTNAQR